MTTTNGNTVNKFEKVTKALQHRNIEDYYLATLQMMTNSTVRKLTADGYTLENNHLEDLRAEIALRYWEVLVKAKSDKVTYSKPLESLHLSQRYDYKEDDVVTVEETEVTAERVSEEWYNVPERLLWTILQSKLKRALYRFFNTKSVNNCISLDLTMHDDIASGGDNRIESIMDRLEDTASRLELSAIELIDSLQGTLTSTEYRYLVDWFAQGRQEKKNFRTVMKIRSALADIQQAGGTDPQEYIHALRVEAERLYRIERRVADLLR